MISVGGYLGNDIPDSTKEVGEDKDEKDKSENLEDVHDDDLLHDLVVIFLAVFLSLRVLLDARVKSLAVVVLDDALHILNLNNLEQSLETEKSKHVQQVQVLYSSLLLC